MRTFVKYFTFSLPFILILIVNDQIQNRIMVSYEEQSTFFIGSSRVQFGINPELLQKGVENGEIYNIGMSASTFLHNIILAEQLITKYKASELYIELSPIHTNFYEDHVFFGISLYDYFKLIGVTNIVDITENYTFEKFSIMAALRRIFMTKLINPNFEGYMYSKENNYTALDSFIQKEHLENKCNYDISKYSKLISHLIRIADTHNTKVSFFLPITFSGENERCIDSAIFASLPDNLKVNYSKEYLDKICNPIHLRDKTHFNYKGAEIMTNYFKDILYN